MLLKLIDCSTTAENAMVKHVVRTYDEEMEYIEKVICLLLIRPAPDVCRCLSAVTESRKASFRTCR